VLREFQRYAAEKMLAQEQPGTGVYADRLKSVTNTAPYAGKAHGHLDADTEAVLMEWEKAENQWRCPVVIETWWTRWTKLKHPDGGKDLKWHVRDRIFNDPASQNVWLWDHGKRLKGRTLSGREDVAANQRARFYAVDLSGRFDHNAVFQALVAEDKGRMLVGQHEVNPDVDGPVSSPKAGTVRRPVTPERISGDTYAKLTMGGQIVYRIARAVSEPECFGFLDSFTSADRAILSIGLCHWTLSRFKGEKVEDGELEAFCAYIKAKKSALFAEMVGRFGLEPVHDWYAKGGTSGLVNSAQRKFETNFKEFAWDHENNKPFQREVPREIARYNMFRSWHWIYRFHILLRIADDLPVMMWDMIRFRIRDLLQVTVPASLGIPENVKGTPLVLGDIFRSEETIVLIVEWHVNAPSTLLTSGLPSIHLAEAIKTAASSKAAIGRAPKYWPSEVETALKNAIFSTLDKNKLVGLRQRVKDRLAFAHRTDFSKEPPPHTKGKRLSNARLEANVDLFDDKTLYPPPKWKS